MADHGQPGGHRLARHEQHQRAIVDQLGQRAVDGSGLTQPRYVELDRPDAVSGAAGGPDLLGEAARGAAREAEVAQHDQIERGRCWRRRLDLHDADPIRSVPRHRVAERAPAYAAARESLTEPDHVRRRPGVPMSSDALAALLGFLVLGFVGVRAGVRWRRLERSRTAELRRLAERGEHLQGELTEARSDLGDLASELQRVRTTLRRLVDDRPTGDWGRVRVTPSQPREPLTRVQRAVSLIDSGHRASGVDSLTELVTAPGRQPRVQAEAALEYGAWRFRAGDLDDAHRYVALARTLSPHGVTAEQLSFEIDLLCARGRADEALRLLDAIDGPVDIDLHARRADVLAASDAPWSDHERAQRRLHVLNVMFIEAGLGPLALADPTRPLGLDNLTAIAAPRTDDPAGPSVTVIMPAHDSAGTIAYALRSVLAQTWTDIEVVIVDDGSTDDTVAVATRVAAGDARVRVESQPRRGAYAARNHGLRVATGELVTFNDADDWSHPEKIARQVEDLRGVPGAVANRSYQVRVDPHLVMQNPADRFRHRRIALNYSSLMFRRSIVDEVGPWDEVRVGADSEFIARLEAYSGDDAVRSVVPDAPLSFVLKSSRSLTNSGATALRALDDALGPRSQYRAAYRAWHRSPAFRTSLPFDPQRRPRPFAHPLAMDLDREPSQVHADLVLAGDLSRRSQHVDGLLALCDVAIARGRSVALLHLPGPVARPRLNDRVIDRVNDGASAAAHSPTLVHLGTPIDTDLLVCWGSAPLGHALDDPPTVAMRRALLVVDHPAELLRDRPDLADLEDDHLSSLLPRDQHGDTAHPSPDIVRVASSASVRDALVDVHGGRRRVADEIVPIVAARPHDDGASDDPGRQPLDELPGTIDPHLQFDLLLGAAATTGAAPPPDRDR